jgi:D-3-phosphoglycerate dehydrogenase / 2-oxoglutarate reductase
LNVAIAVAEQMVDFLAQGVVRYAVNVPSVSPELLEILRPYLTLGEKLGSLHTQMAGALPKEVQVEYRGDVTQYNVAPFTLAVLKGLLTPVMESAVNYVNAPVIARERGIQIVESKGERAGDFTSSMIVKAKNGKEAFEVEGAIFGSKHPRIVRVNDFYFEAVPEGYILVLQNKDVPGRGRHHRNYFGEKRHQHRRHGTGPQRKGRQCDLVHPRGRSHKQECP